MGGMGLEWRAAFCSQCTMLNFVIPSSMLLNSESLSRQRRVVPLFRSREYRANTSSLLSGSRYGSPVARGCVLVSKSSSTPHSRTKTFS